MQLCQCVCNPHPPKCLCLSSRFCCPLPTHSLTHTKTHTVSNSSHFSRKAPSFVIALFFFLSVLQKTFFLSAVFLLSCHPHPVCFHSSVFLFCILSFFFTHPGCLSITDFCSLSYLFNIFSPASFPEF